MKRSLLLLSLFLLSLQLFSATLTVDDGGTADYLTIQSAINAASFGDTVFVYPGTYNEQITLQNGVSLIGSGADITTINGMNLYNQVVSYSGPDAALISGFRITGSSTYSFWTTCGIYSGGGQLSIMNNVITGNYAGICIAGGKPNIVNNTIVDNFTGIVKGASGIPTPPPAPCYPSLPNPELVVTGSEIISGGTYIQYNLRITNYFSYPNDLFVAAPHLPPCGLNTNSSRTWVHIYDQDDNRIYGFCALGSVDSLWDSLWFAVEPDNIPDEVYIIIEDRECGISYTSNKAAIDARPSAYTILNNIIANNTNAGLFFYRYLGAGQIYYNDVWGNGGLDYFNNNTGSSFTPLPGTGEIHLDPEFSDTDYHLAETSPCIDAGHPGVIHNDPDGTRNDMGAYGGMLSYTGPPSHSGSGFVFTSIGKIPVSEITQDTADPAVGLANVSSLIASEFGIHQYKNSPLGGRLWIHGLFGESVDDNKVKYYQILAGKWIGSLPPPESSYVPLSDSLTKVKYTVNSDGSVDYDYVNLGPKSISSYDNLYELTRTGYWTHIDLRMIWNTNNWENGKYSLKYIAYEEELVWDGLSWVKVLSPITLFDNEQDEIVVLVDNSNVEAEIIEVRHKGLPIDECGKILLDTDTDNISFLIRAWHPNGYLHKYWLKALYGKNKSAGFVGSDQYVPNHDSSVMWYGLSSDWLDSLTAYLAGDLDAWTTCAYQFRLYVMARTTDGFHYIKGREFNDHYYLEVPECKSCIKEEEKAIKEEEKEERKEEKKADK